MNRHVKGLLYCAFMLLLLAGCTKQEEVFNEDAEPQITFEPVSVDDALFRYTMHGNGIPCIVFVGGEKIGQRIYSDELRTHIQLIYADQSYLEPEEIKDLTLDMIIDDIEKARKALGVDKIAVMGHSMFGPLPLEYAVKYPDHVSHAIITGSVPFITDEYYEAASEYWESNASEERKQIREINRRKLAEEDENEASANERFIKQYIADIPMRFYDPHYDMSDLWAGVDVNIDFVNRYAGVLLQDFNHVDSYAGIDAPVLVIAGKYDYPAPYFLWDDVKDIIPDLTFHLFENAGHNPMLEIPEEFDRVVVEWIKSP